MYEVLYNTDTSPIGPLSFSYLCTHSNLGVGFSFSTSLAWGGGGV